MIAILDFFVKSKLGTFIDITARDSRTPDREGNGVPGTSRRNRRKGSSGSF
jgi:hypothetical protein